VHFFSRRKKIAKYNIIRAKKKNAKIKFPVYQGTSHAEQLSVGK